MVPDDRTLDSHATLVGGTSSSRDTHPALRSAESAIDDSLMRAIAEAPPVPLPPEQLSHPNVIAVHEVGRYEDRIFIAMELVDGGTVREWLATPRTWHEVVDVFVQAAEGLAAAHARGLVHRDFKPDNMLVGRDGRVRVADFGLARAAGSLSSTDSPLQSQDNPFDDLASSGSLDVRLTRTGTAVGTPAYMAPEQVTGIGVDARADQFAFCVALHEALYGVRPFVGRSMTELLAAAAVGDVVAPPSDRTVPGWVRAVVLRGLSPDPSRRYPDMRALVAALAADPGRRRRRVVFGIGVVGTLAFTAWVSRSTVTEPDPCARAGQAVADVYDDAVGESVATSLRAVDPVLGASAAQRVTPLLSDYASSLAAAHVRACEANERGEQSDAMFDQRVGCLVRAQNGLQAALDVLTADADLHTVENAVDLVVGLALVEACDDVASLSTVVPLPTDPERAAAIETVWAEATTVDALQKAGRYAEVERRIRPLVYRGLALDYPPLSRMVLTLAGQQDSDGDDSSAAADAHARAYRHAIEGGEFDKAGIAAAQLAEALGNRPARYAEAARWLEAAWGASRAFDYSPSQQVALTATEATVLYFGDRFTQAAATAERGLQMVRAQPVTPRTRRLEIQLLVRRGTALSELASYDAALVALDDARALADSLYGAEHPRLAAILANSARVASNSGDHTRGIAMVERAANILAASHGRDSVNYADMLMQVAIAQTRAGHVDEAVELEQKVLEIAEKAAGDNLPLMAMAASNLSGGLGQLGRTHEAEEYARKAVGLVEQAFGKDSLKAAQARLNYAVALQRNGDDENAVEPLVKAREVLVATHGRVHPSVVIVDLNLALAYLGVDDFTSAHAILDEAEASAEKLEGDPRLYLARTWATRASLLDHQERDEEARRIGAQAIETYAALGQRSVEYASTLLQHGRRVVDREEAVRWLTLSIEIGDERNMEGDRPIVARWLLAEALGNTDPKAAALRAEAAERFEKAPDLPESPEVAEQIRAYLRRRNR